MFTPMTGTTLQHKQSPVWTILFIMPLLFVAQTSVFGSEKDQKIAETIPVNTREYTSMRFAAHLGATYHYPVKHAAENWKPFITAGIHCDLPTYIPKFLLHFSTELGTIAMTNNVWDHTIKVAYGTVSASYDFSVMANTFILRPHIGLSNTMITDKPFSARDLFSILNETESEHGLFFSLQPMYFMKKITVTLPIAANIMFSSPEAFITGTIALTIGYTF